MPALVTDREMIQMTSMVFLKQKKSIIVVQRSIHTPTCFGVEIPPETKDHVRIDLKKGFRCLSRDASGKTQFQML